MLYVSISVLRHLADIQPAAKTKLGIETTTAEVMMMVLEETFTSECKTFNCVEIETIHRHVARHVLGAPELARGTDLELVVLEVRGEDCLQGGAGQVAPQPRPGPRPQPRAGP